jgi:hypothetical protein
LLGVTNADEHLHNMVLTYNQLFANIKDETQTQSALFTSELYVNIASYNQVFSKAFNFPLFFHIKKFIFEKLDCHLQYIIPTNIN